MIIFIIVSITISTIVMQIFHYRSALQYCMHLQYTNFFTKLMIKVKVNAILTSRVGQYFNISSISGN